MSPRLPADPVAIAIASLADAPLTPERRLVEVGRLSSVLYKRAEIDRASGINEDEVEAGCRITGDLTRRMLAARAREAAPHPPAEA